jgi:hypothetical protein
LISSVGRQKDWERRWKERSEAKGMVRAAPEHLDRASGLKFMFLEISAENRLPPHQAGLMLFLMLQRVNRVKPKSIQNRHQESFGKLRQQW